MRAAATARTASLTARVGPVSPVGPVGVVSPAAPAVSPAATPVGPLGLVGPAGDRLGGALRRLGREQAGAISVFAVVIASVLLLVAGLCVEGGRVLNERATLTDQAEQAARAGAQQLDSEGVRSGEEVSLDTSAATSAARSYLAGVGLSGGAEVTEISVTSREVSVTVEREVPTTMLRLVGVGSVHVTTTGDARVVTGIYEEDDL